MKALLMSLVFSLSVSSAFAECKLKNPIDLSTLEFTHGTESFSFAKVTGYSPLMQKDLKLHLHYVQSDLLNLETMPLEQLTLGARVEERESIEGMGAAAWMNDEDLSRLKYRINDVELHQIDYVLTHDFDGPRKAWYTMKSLVKVQDNQVIGIEIEVGTEVRNHLTGARKLVKKSICVTEASR